MRCDAVIRQVFYDAWAQPGREEVGAGTAALATVRFRSDGAVVGRTLTRKSGNAIMDGSVMQALNAVDHVDGLTPEFLKNRDYEAQVEFKLER